ncbi:zinc finger protein 678-like [Littorina saxatilis]
MEHSFLNISRTSTPNTSTWDGGTLNSRATNVEDLRSWIKTEKSDSRLTNHRPETTSQCNKQGSKKSRPPLLAEETKISFVASEETWTLWQNLSKEHSLDDRQLAALLVKQHGDKAQETVCSSCHSPLGHFCSKCFILVPNPGCEEVPNTSTITFDSDAETSGREDMFDVELEEITQPITAGTVEEGQTSKEEAIVPKVEPETSDPDELWDGFIAQGKGIVACSFCDVSFPSIKGLTKHTAIHISPQWQREHRPEPRRTSRRQKNIPNYCNAEEDTWTEPVDIRENISATTDTTKKSIKCIFCGTEYKKAVSLTKHLQKHLKKNAFKCCVCVKFFDSVGELDLHLRSHPTSKFHCDGEASVENKSHQCRICGIRFRYLGFLANHAQKHSEPNPFWCSACESGFQYLADYTGHHCQTTEEKPELQAEQTHALQDFSSDDISLEPVFDNPGLSGSDGIFLSSTKGHSEQLNNQQAVTGDTQGAIVDANLTVEQQQPTAVGVEEHEALRRKNNKRFVRGSKFNKGGAFKCPDCPSSFKYASYLKIHSQKHTGRNAFSCSHCELTFPSKKQLLTHQERVHWGSAPITCQECGRVVKSMLMLDEHMRLHTGELPFECQICGEKFRTHAAVSVHRRAHKTDLLTCKECGATFTDYAVYKTHMEEHAGIKPHLCSMCGDAFALRHNLKKHMLKHGQKQFICEHCGHAFYTAGEHKLHVMRHLGIKPFTCELCDKSFIRKEKLNRHHISVHLREKPFKCKLCPLAYSDVSRLNEHFRAIHTNERPYKCPVCGKAFAKSGCRQAHLRIHKREGKFL